jgi:4-hydroxybenzoate polyprenyltransferase
MWLLLSPLVVWRAYFELLAWLAFSALYLAFGYAINDYSDRDIDYRAGKPNAIGELSTNTAFIWLIALATAGMTLLIPFVANPYLPVTALVSYVIAIAYSVRPLRLKERGLIGLLVAAFAQRSAPLMIGMGIFQSYGEASWLLVVLFVIIGLRWMLVHQLLDFDSDRHTQVATFVQSIGKDRATALMKHIIFPMEVICFCLWVGNVCMALPAIIIVVPIYLVWQVGAFLARRGVAPMYSWTRYGFLPLTDLYYVFLPLTMGALLVAQDPRYAILFIMWIGLQLSFLRSRLGLPWKYAMMKRSQGDLAKKEEVQP